MGINTFLNAVEGVFNTQLNGVKTLEQHAGPFTPGTILEKQFSAPAVFLGCSGAQEPRDQDRATLSEYGQVMACRFTAITVGKHAKSLTAASRIALLLAEQIVLTLYRQNFDQDYAGHAYNLVIEPVAQGSAKQGGHLSFWKVSWWHGMALLPESLQPLIDDFEGYDAEHFEPGAEIHTEAPAMETEENYP